jgi:hypothetical protein
VRIADLWCGLMHDEAMWARARLVRMPDVRASATSSAGGYRDRGGEVSKGIGRNQAFFSETGSECPG